MTLKEAIQAGKENRLKEWIYDFIMNEHSKHIEFFNELELEERYFFGPLEINLNELTRIAGPEEHMEYIATDEWWDTRIPLLMNLVKER